MQLVLLPFEPREDTFRARKFPAELTLEDGVALAGGELAEGNVERDALRAGKTFQFLPDRAEARLGPGLDNAIIDGFTAVGNHPVEIEVYGVAESLAARAGPVRIVEGKQARFGLLVDQPAGLALEALVENHFFGHALGGLAGLRNVLRRGEQ